VVLGPIHLHPVSLSSWLILVGSTVHRPWTNSWAEQWFLGNIGGTIWPYTGLRYEPAQLVQKPNPRFKRPTALFHKYPMPRLLIVFMSLVALTLPIMAVAAVRLLQELVLWQWLKLFLLILQLCACFTLCIITLDGPTSETATACGLLANTGPTTTLWNFYRGQPRLSLSFLVWYLA
jgi:hypothetical protein